MVIWACGYKTNRIPIRDHEGKEIGLSQNVPNTQYDIDNKCRLKCADGSVLTKAFGIGIAYPTRTNDGRIGADPNKPEPRADSFSLYSNWVANRVILNLLPKTMLDNKLHRIQRNNTNTKGKAADANNGTSPQKATTEKASPQKKYVKKESGSSKKAAKEPKTAEKEGQNPAPEKPESNSMNT